MIKLLTIVGARPQFIKAAALSRAVGNSFQSLVREVILHTGQHYDPSMSDIFFREMRSFTWAGSPRVKSAVNPSNTMLGMTILRRFPRRRTMRSVKKP